MPDLSFKVESVNAMEDSATPVLAFVVRIANAVAGEEVRSASLNCQVHIHPAWRRYAPAEQRALADLFGGPERWGTTLRPLFWAAVSVTVSSFQNEVTVAVRVPCTFDMNVAATKYCHALEGGEIPVLLLFSGMVFYSVAGSLQVAPVSWSREAECRVPAAVWKKMIALYCPNSAWLILRNDVFERLYRYKVQHGLPTWDQAVEHMLAATGEPCEAKP